MPTPLCIVDVSWSSIKAKTAIPKNFTSREKCNELQLQSDSNPMQEQSCYNTSKASSPANLWRRWVKYTMLNSEASVDSFISVKKDFIIYNIFVLDLPFKSP